MAELTFGRDLSLPRLRVQAVEWVLAHREIVALVSIMAVAALLRFWALDVKALHHDESLHAQYTWYLYHGAGYKHDPLMHGPFLFHSGAVIFFLFGASDYTIRVLPALFGTALVGMPYLLRKQIGMPAVFIAAVLITISPTLLYVSRFYRDDIYIDVWMMAMVICVWRYLDEQKPRYLYGLAAALSLAFATMEITFILAAIMLVFLDLMLAVELGKTKPGEKTTRQQVLLRTVAMMPVAWLIAAAWPLLGKRPMGQDRLPPVGDLIVVIGTLALPQFSAAIQRVPLFGLHDQGYNVPSENELRNLTVLSLMLASAYVGLLWRPRHWLIIAAAFYIPYVLLYTTFLTNMNGFFSGIWGSLDYWLAQQDVKRGNQPIYYYALMTPLYEFLPLLLALGGSVWLAIRGDSLRRWLVFWLLGICVGLTYAGEKMPWLEVHIALPLCLVAALTLSGIIGKLRLEGRQWRSVALVGAGTVLATLVLVETDGIVRFAGGLLFAALCGWAVAQLATRDRSAFGRAALAIGVSALMFLTLRAALTLSFVNEDTPVEMAVYTQTSHEVPDLVTRIDALAQQSGLGHNLPIVVDQTDGYAWPWAWYLRDYHNVSFITPSTPNYRPPDGAVMLINRANVSDIDDTGYTQTPYRHRWWFNETYRGLTVSKVASILTHVKSLESLGNFFLYRREAGTTTGSSDAVAYFPQSLAAFDVDQTPAKPPIEPKSLPDGRIVLGETGSGPGQMLQPTGLTVDSQGNIWLADSRNNRIQEFDAQGHYIASLGRANGANFNEPWSVAVSNDGFIYVTDTWNHTIEKFSPDLQLVTSWGVPSVKQVPGPLDLFGPRDIIVVDDGSVWVTDTGNKRLVHYSADGDPLGVFGSGGSGPGQFNEPVGLARDAQGRFYVADTWNARIQRFAPDLTAAASIPTTWASQDVLAKPYLAVLSDGRILATDPARGLLLLFDATGNALGTWRPATSAMPIGVVALADGGFAFSDARANEVQIVPANLIENLFH